MAGHRWLNTIDDQGIVTNCDRYDTIERVVPRIFPRIEKYTLSIPSSLSPSLLPLQGGSAGNLQIAIVCGEIPILG